MRTRVLPFAAAPGSPVSARSFTEAQRAEIVGILREALEGLELAEQREGAGRAAIAIAINLAQAVRAVVPSGGTRLKKERPVRPLACIKAPEFVADAHNVAGAACHRGGAVPVMTSAGRRTRQG